MFKAFPPGETFLVLAKGRWQVQLWKKVSENFPTDTRAIFQRMSDYKFFNTGNLRAFRRIRLSSSLL
jgi:hypothetical protein